MHANKVPGNVTGRYYTTTECIDCDLCRETAPTVFDRNADLGFSIVIRQPATAEEVVQAEEALVGCPCEAILKD